MKNQFLLVSKSFIFLTIIFFSLNPLFGQDGSLFNQNAISHIKVDLGQSGQSNVGCVDPDFDFVLSIDPAGIDLVSPHANDPNPTVSIQLMIDGNPVVVASVTLNEYNTNNHSSWDISISENFECNEFSITNNISVSMIVGKITPEIPIPHNHDGPHPEEETQSGHMLAMIELCCSGDHFSQQTEIETEHLYFNGVNSRNFNTLNLKLNDEFQNIYVLNSLGKVVMAGKDIKLFWHSENNLSPGMYFLCSKDNGKLTLIEKYFLN